MYFEWDTKHSSPERARSSNNLVAVSQVSWIWGSGSSPEHKDSAVERARTEADWKVIPTPGEAVSFVNFPDAGGGFFKKANGGGSP
jgi:hypothetical protein